MVSYALKQVLPRPYAPTQFQANISVRVARIRSKPLRQIIRTYYLSIPYDTRAFRPRDAHAYRHKRTRTYYMRTTRRNLAKPLVLAQNTSDILQRLDYNLSPAYARLAPS